MASPESLDAWWAALPFIPDPFQRQAVEHLLAGASVVVTAPTGAGKTLIAEAAVELARLQGTRAFYTTPIKALSNQKFGDLRSTYGEEAVGLLTGDNVVNGDAGIVVMTTEVLRNMIYADPGRLNTLGIVILDEVHYLQDRYRGSVWEEVIIHLPRHVQLVNLSATMANPEEFTDWVRARRGRTELVVERHRPVPLESTYLLKDRHREHRLEHFAVFDRSGKRPNPVVVKLLRKGRGRFRRFAQPRRLEVAEHLQALGVLPAIYFIFSRAGCDQAAQLVAAARLGLTEPGEREEIRAVAAARTAHVSPQDLDVLGYTQWLAGLEEGVAAHHAGMVPAFKETVEVLFAAGLVKIVFATETLALGINMPAKTVVLERLSKFTGDSHELLQPGDYTQLTGRAGRRGIDTSGTAVVLHQRDIPFDRIAAIAAQGSHPLVSSFAPTYNMAVNLVANYPQERAEELLRASFAQHRLEARRQALHDRMERREAEAAELRAAAQCDRGDIVAFADSHSAVDVRRQMRDFAQSMVPGDVLEVPRDGGVGRWAMVARGYGPNPRLMLVGSDGELWQLAAEDLAPATAIIGTVEVPEPFRPRERAFRRHVATALGSFHPGERRGIDVSGDVPDPVARCPDLAAHLSWLERARKAERDAARLRDRMGSSRDDLVTGFHRLLDLLGAYGYVEDWSLTEKGERLRFVYNELDLLVAESAHRGLLDGLDPAELAGAMTIFVYEPRRDDIAAALPASLTAPVDAIAALSDEIALAEDSRRLEMARAPDDGYVGRLHDWASGATLEDLFEEEAAAGDFVRIARQTLDLLRQVKDVFPSIRGSAIAAIDRVDRGVVAAEGGW